ncbi:sigma-54-dependent Fis family transcriptional regulator [Saccharospirillum sp. HFRX-1]|uniref:sigma-54-dependent Fis family transcriptional regulator n=1 Tax=unclassified Saccharospirillum TaxID=2633430 RepID=UPI003713764B
MTEMDEALLQGLQSSQSDTADLPHHKVIENSWSRCESYGLSHSSQPQFGEVRQGHVAALLDEHHNLVHTTENEVLPHYQNILSNSACLIVLADNQGQVLNTWGSNRFHDSDRHGLLPGYQWREVGTGTNAIGTALATGQAVQVSRDEHFLRANRYMVGSASPIYDTHKKMIGVLDISSDAYLPQDHTLGMVKLMSLSVENQLIYAAFQREHFIVTFSANISGLDSHWSGMLVLDDSGKVISANRRAWAMLAQDLALLNIEQIFDCRFLELCHQPANTPLSLKAFGQYHTWVRVQPPLAPPLKIPDYRQAQAEQTPTEPKAASTPKPHRLPADVVPFNELEHGDPVVRQVLLQLSKVIEKDIPVLIHGETGAGKEILVRSLHYHGSRRNKNLVAVNCASIPADLIESELFGYHKGAFTGASQEGAVGLIRRADGGTLFLDEIGEMPITMQARLLRVLQERVVTPLGSTETYPIDIRLVSATNRDLKQAVQQGTFRQDLYYRLAGLNVTIPPLRQRTDKAELINYATQRLQPGNPNQTRLSPAVLDLFLQHPWPGNMRQLSNVLKVASAMSDDGIIKAEHLPKDFYDDLNTPPEYRQPQAPDSNPADAIQTSQAEKIRTYYQQTGGNISRTARLAGVSRNTVYKYLR